MTTTAHDLGNNETASTGVSGPDADGFYTALTRTRSKRFRTRAGAEHWLWRRGYLPDGRQRPVVDEAAAQIAKPQADHPQIAAYRERLRQRGMLVPDGTLPPGYHVIGAEAQPPAIERAIQLLAAELNLTPPGASGTPTVKLELKCWTRTADGAIGAVVSIASAPGPETVPERQLYRLLIGRALLPSMPYLARDIAALAHDVLADRRLPWR